MREHNEELVLQALSARGPRTIDELRSDTGLGRATIYSALTDGAVVPAALTSAREVRLRSGPGGRAKAYYGLKPYVALGFEFDHDRIRTCITELRGLRLWQEEARLTAEDENVRVVTTDAEHESVGEERRSRTDERRLRARLAPSANPEQVRTSGAVDNYPGFALQIAVEQAQRGLMYLRKSPPPFWLDPNHVAVQHGDTGFSEPVTKRHVLGVAVSMAAPVDLETRTASPGVLPGWKDIQPAETLRAALGLQDRVRLIIGNDANLGAWAEYRYASEAGNRYGLRRPPKCLLYIKTAPGPSGIGAGLVSQDSRGEVSIFRGANLAGEIGHVPLDWPRQRRVEKSGHVQKCPHCQRTSCLQARTALPVFLHDSQFSGWDEVVEHLRGLDPPSRYLLPEAKAVVAASARLGRTLGIAVTLFNPDLIVVAGPLSHALATSENAVRYRDVSLARDDADRPLLTELKRVALPDAYARLREGRAVFRTGLGSWGVALGAAARALEFETQQVPFFRREHLPAASLSSEH